MEKCLIRPRRTATISSGLSRETSKGNRETVAKYISPSRTFRSEGLAERNEFELAPFDFNHS